MLICEFNLWVIYSVETEEAVTEQYLKNVHMNKPTSWSLKDSD